MPEFHVAAVCTRHAETAQATADKYGIPQAFTSPEELAASPDVDIVSNCVRVPGHRDLVAAALNAGKHVYCEWPLGANSREAKEMRDLAEAKNVRHMVGLQSRGAPAVGYLKQLVADGYVGQVVSCSIVSSLPGAGTKSDAFAWSVDAELGANTLTIPGGHSIDALCYVLGEFREVSGKVTTQMTTATNVDTGEELRVTAPDQMLVSGILESGATASVHISNVPAHGTGLHWEIHGTEGSLIASAGGAVQYASITIRGGKRGGTGFEELPVPAQLRRVPAGVPEGPPLNVGQMFARLAQGIRDGSPVDPDFEVAVTRHRLLDAITAASDTGRTQTL
jgi:predicted dehydrogenase